MAKQINNPGSDTKPAGTGNIPRADLEIATLAVNVGAKWAENPWLTLRWTTSAAFATKAAAFKTTVSSKKQSASTRPQLTKALNDLDKEIDRNLSYVKNFITAKFKKENAQSHYPAFGIVYESEGHRIPKDQDKRLEALDLMLSAINTNGFDDQEYGKVYWTAIRTQYDSLLQQARTKDGIISEKVGGKNVMKTEIIMTLNALIKVIAANYPETYKEELRSWGFQKEKY